MSLLVCSIIRACKRRSIRKLTSLDLLLQFAVVSLIEVIESNAGRLAQTMEASKSLDLLSLRLKGQLLILNLSSMRVVMLAAG